MSAAIAHAAEQLIAAAEVLVHPNVEMVVVIRLAAIHKIIVYEAGAVRCWIKLQQLQRVRINAGGGQLVH